MKSKILTGLTLMVVLLICAVGSTTVSAQGNNAYPKFINDSIVGITIDQVDEFNFLKIDRDERYFTIKLYETTILEYDSELIKLQAYNNALESANRYQSKQIAENLKAIMNYTSVVDSKDREIKEAKKVLEKQKRKTIVAWIAVGFITGAITILYITK